MKKKSKSKKLIATSLLMLPEYLKLLHKASDERGESMGSLVRLIIREWFEARDREDFNLRVKKSIIDEPTKKERSLSPEEFKKMSK